jgi:hypothetical protein
MLPKVEPKVGGVTTDSRLTNLKQTLLFSKLAHAMFMLMEFLGYTKQCCFVASVKPSSHEHLKENNAFSTYLPTYLPT